MLYRAFDSQLLYTEFCLDRYKEEVIKNEPMLFSCDAKHSRELGGPITHQFLDFLEKIYPKKKYIIDSRVHMAFTEGIYCCIPGFHHDNVPRTDYNGQPDYNQIWNPIDHVVALVNGDIAPTEFAVGEATFPDIEEGEKYYKKWHPIVEKYIEFGQLRRESLEDRRLYKFNSEAFHQGTPTRKTGWRFFIRATMDNPWLKAANEVRKQVQVYLPNPMEGW
jgi:hypothetical protein